MDMDKDNFSKTKIDLDTSSYFTPKKKTWGFWVFLVIAAVGLLWWYRSSEPRNMTASTTDTSRMHVAQNRAPAASIQTLSKFLATGEPSELPMRFGFQNIRFVSGTADLIAGAKSELDILAATLKEYPTVTAKVEGYTDSTGDMARNQNLSMKRAAVVRQELIKRGVASTRLDAAGRGPASPVATNDTVSGRAKNRRIEFVVLKLR